MLPWNQSWKAFDCKAEAGAGTGSGIGVWCERIELKGSWPRAVRGGSTTWLNVRVSGASETQV